MPQNLSMKRYALALDMVKQASSLLAAAGGLTSDAGILTQAGGNFEDTDFDGTTLPIVSKDTPLAYLNAFSANVLLQQVVPALNTWLDTPLSGTAGTTTYRQYLETVVPGAV